MGTRNGLAWFHRKRPRTRSEIRPTSPAATRPKRTDQYRCSRALQMKYLRVSRRRKHRRDHLRNQRMTGGTRSIRVVREDLPFRHPLKRRENGKRRKTENDGGKEMIGTAK